MHIKCSDKFYFILQYLEYMLDENLDERSKCLKNTLKR